MEILAELLEWQLILLPEVTTISAYTVSVLLWMEVTGITTVSTALPPQSHNALGTAEIFQKLFLLEIVLGIVG